LVGDLERTAAGLGHRIRTSIVLAWRATGRGFIEFYQSENLTFSASIAYYTLLSIFPFLLIILAVISRLAVVQAGNEGAVVELLSRALPSNFNFLSEQIVQLQRSPVPLTIAGTLITLWAAMGVFGALTSAVNHAWGTDKPYSFWQHKLVAFIMMIAAGVLFTGGVLLASAGQFQHTRVLATLRDWFPFLADWPNVLMRYSLFPASVLSIGLIYYFAPNTRVRLRDVWFGAVLAATLWLLALEGFSWYLRGFSRFDMHGSVGTVVAFLVWVYLSAVILLYGVEVTAAYARLRRELAAEEAKATSAQPSGA
jgi:membrane protein